MSLSRTLKTTNGRDIGRLFLRSLNGLFGLWIATTSALLQILGILTWRMQQVKKKHFQNFRADLAWSLNSRKIESNSGDFFAFTWLRALATSSGVKGPDMRCPSGVGTFHRSGTSLLMSLVDSLSFVLCAPFFTIGEAIEFAENGAQMDGRGIQTCH